MQLLRNSTRRFSSKNGPASACRAWIAACVPRSGFALARRSESICSHEQISVSLIRFVRQHLRTPLFRWMIRDDCVQNSYLMQAVGTDMTCADNISAVQHEKRACRVKCALYTQSQEATKTNGTTLTESRRNNDLRTAWIYPHPSGSTAPSRRTIPLNSPWCRWHLSASPVRRSMCSFKLICSSPGYAVVNQPHVSTFRSQTRSWHLVPIRPNQRP